MYSDLVGAALRVVDAFVKEGNETGLRAMQAAEVKAHGPHTEVAQIIWRGLCRLDDREEVRVLGTA